MVDDFENFTCIDIEQIFRCFILNLQLNNAGRCFKFFLVISDNNIIINIQKCIQLFESDTFLLKHGYHIISV